MQFGTLILRTETEYSKYEDITAIYARQLIEEFKARMYISGEDYTIEWTRSR